MRCACGEHLIPVGIFEVQTVFIDGAVATRHSADACPPRCLMTVGDGTRNLCSLERGHAGAHRCTGPRGITTEEALRRLVAAAVAINKAAVPLPGGGAFIPARDEILWKFCIALSAAEGHMASAHLPR